jgi:hypothetical protein
MPTSCCRKNVKNLLETAYEAAPSCELRSTGRRFGTFWNSNINPIAVPTEPICSTTEAGMLIRLEIHSSESPIDPEPDFNMNLTVGGPEPLQVGLIPISIFDPEGDEDIPSLFIRCEQEWKPPQILIEYIAETELRELPPAYSSASPQRPAAEYLQRSFAFGSSLRRIEKTNRKVGRCVRSLDDRLTSAALRVANLFRWRFNVSGSSNLAEKRTLLFSSDGTTWYVLLSTVKNWALRIGSAAEINGATESELQHMLNANATEPLAHNLLREALIQRDENRRSALVMAVGAAEVGFKRFVSTLVPATAFLMEEVQAPPIYRMLKEFLPTLLENTSTRTPGHLPESEILKPIEKAFEHRNTIVHKPDDSPRQAKASAYLVSSDFDASLRAISDLLYILDFYAGNEWAIGNVSNTILRHWSSQTN